MASEHNHNQLIEEGYVFLGWRAVRDEMVVDYLKHNRQWPTGSTGNTGMAGKLVNGREWNGLWLSSIVERCYAYATEYAMERPKTERLPWIFRVYLKRADIDELTDEEVMSWRIIQNENGEFEPDINDTNSALSGEVDTKYILWGPDGAFEGTEMVLSPMIAHKARFVLSTFTVRGFRKIFGEFRAELDQNTDEEPTTSYGNEEDYSDKDKLLNAENNF